MIYRPPRGLQARALLYEEFYYWRQSYFGSVEKNLSGFKFFSRIGSYPPSNDYELSPRPLRFDGKLFVIDPHHCGHIFDGRARWRAYIEGEAGDSGLCRTRRAAKTDSKT
jgi:hypothetical protein